MPQTVTQDEFNKRVASHVAMASELVERAQAKAASAEKALAALQETKTAADREIKASADATFETIKPLVKVASADAVRAQLMRLEDTHEIVQQLATKVAEQAAELRSYRNGTKEASQLGSPAAAPAGAENVPVVKSADDVWREKIGMSTRR